MADTQLSQFIQSLFEGMDSVLSSKTVVGEPTRIDDTIIVPLVDVTFGMGAGGTKGAGGGIGGKVSPSAVLVIRDGHARVVNIKNQDTLSKLVDLVPDVLDKISTKKADMPDNDEATEIAFPDRDNSEG